MEDVGKNYGDYFALIFFILSGVAISASFQSLLMLFLGIEIISIPLYILTGSDKRSLKSNEASLKYFLMGSFSTGLMLMGIALIYGQNGTFMTVAPCWVKMARPRAAHCRYDAVALFHVLQSIGRSFSFLDTGCL
jgi:NADH:ubiquinone oxidoreductase subunit 2 (subunit N)